MNCSLPYFHIVQSSRTNQNITKHGWSVERRQDGEINRAKTTDKNTNR
jgi:hypothetical protein